MKTHYVPHFFGNDAVKKVQGRIGWLTVGVASSIAWPEDDVWVKYDGVEFFLHGARQEDDCNVAPCISTPSKHEHTDNALSRLYRFTSVLGYFKRGYVDITGSIWGSRMVRYSNPRDTFTTLLQGGKRSFSCNHMPVIEDDQVRKALAFLREGRRLQLVHEPYSFLSFFKVIESQLKSKARVSWVEKNLDRITDERAVKQIKELRDRGHDVNKHLYKSGRCAVAHASVNGDIVDPDIPADRKRIGEDLQIMEALADHYVKVELEVPDEMDVYSTRDRVSPWHVLMTPEAVATLKAGEQIEHAKELGKLEGATVSVRLWPDPPAAQFDAMTLLPIECHEGIVKFIALSTRGTIILAFAMDVANGRVHTLLNESGMRAKVEITEQDVEDYTRFLHSVVDNRIVELTIEGAEPIDCEVVVPVNIIPQAPEEAVTRALEQFSLSKQSPDAKDQS